MKLEPVICSLCGERVFKCLDGNSLPGLVTIRPDLVTPVPFPVLLASRGRNVMVVPPKYQGEGQTVYEWHELRYYRFDPDAKQTRMPLNIVCGTFARPEDADYDWTYYAKLSRDHELLAPVSVAYGGAGI